MNKLVSRNPVLRFKEGRKIIFAQQGGMLTYKGDPIIAIENGRGAVDKGNGMFLWVPTNKFDTDNSRKFYQKANSIKSSLTSSIKNLFNLKSSDSKNGTPLTKNKVIFNPVDNYYLKGFENRKDEIAKLGGVRAVLEMLGFKGKDLDGKWGQNTEAAYLKYLLDQSNKKVLDSLSSTTPLTNFSNPIIENPSNINILVPKQTYNRTQTREFLRNKGVNPYQFTGALRKALRMVMNGQGTDEDKALVQGMGIFKQGGNLLPSRNIVKRFKQGGILKFLTAGNLPTAPKAEKRYRKSSSNTTKKENRETTTITSQTFGYNRNWPYFRQPATILRIIEGRDTAFVETPEHHIFTKVLPRTALKSGNNYTEYNPKYDENYSLGGQANTSFNYSVKPLEYEILKRRFNTAWNLAK